MINLMPDEAKNIQQKKINEIVSVFLNFQKEEITYKAPTGSGKTFVIMSIINNILLKNKNYIFLVLSLSKGLLAKQNHDKFKNYIKNINNNFLNLKPYLIETKISNEEKLFIPNNYNIYSLPKDLYKKKSKLKENGSFVNFLKEIKKTKKIILIKDESHTATKNIDQLKLFDRIINFTATPRAKQYVDVEMTEKEAIDSKLIKEYKYNLKKSIHIDDIQLELPKIINKFNIIKKKYLKHFRINPCLLIQISNKSKGENELNVIKNVLVTFREIEWMYMVYNEKNFQTNTNYEKLKSKKKQIWNKYIKSSSSPIDILIFKLKISEGYDIPRACMLIQIRKSESEIMPIQVIGRIRRNPILLEWKKYNNAPELQKYALTSWIWSDIKEERKFRIVNKKKNDRFNWKIPTTIIETQLENFKNTPINIDKYLKNNINSLIKYSIFDLYKKWNNADYDLLNQCWKKILNFYDWKILAIQIDEINKKYKNSQKNYEESMRIGKYQEIQNSSYFEITNNYLEINNEKWIWKISYKNIDNDEYSFEGKFEKDFCKKIRDISYKNNFKIWGRNFYPNSKIGFQYIDKYNSIKTSYPDFFIIDKNNIIHIIETKSIDHNNTNNFENEYKEKIEYLKECYKWASKITKIIFYIPIKTKDKLIIYYYKNGKEKYETSWTLINNIGN